MAEIHSNVVRAIAPNNRQTADRGAPIESEELIRQLEDIGSALHSLKVLARQGITSSSGASLLAGMEALSAQAGYLVDSALARLGDPGVVGDFEAWRQA